MPSFRPLNVTLPDAYSGHDAAQSFFGVVPESGPVSLKVAALAMTAPLSTYDTEIWSAFEMRLARTGGQPGTQESPYVEQVQEVLYALLPTGCSTVEHVADNLR